MAPWSVFFSVPKMGVVSQKHPSWILLFLSISLFNFINISQVKQAVSVCKTPRDPPPLSPGRPNRTILFTVGKSNLVYFKFSTPGAQVLFTSVQHSLVSRVWPAAPQVDFEDLPGHHLSSWRQLQQRVLENFVETIHFIPGRGQILEFRHNSCHLATTTTAAAALFIHFHISSKSSTWPVSCYFGPTMRMMQPQINRFNRSK